MEEWAVQAESFKDPENAVYYSNRSAAYLAMGDARGKALKDAEQCLKLRPDWWKGYSRKGAAEYALQRFDAARRTYNEGLRLNPDNSSLLQALEEAYVAGQAYSKRLGEEEQLRQEIQQQQQQLRREEEDEKEKKTLKTIQEKERKEEMKKPQVDDTLLAEFMAQVQELEENTNCITKDEETSSHLKKKNKVVDFGTSDGQIERLLQPHFNWINLNPFRVLMLDVDATEEDMKQHYRKISTLVHPDKSRNPKAREAFEEVKKAYNVITEEDRRKTCIRTIENATQAVDKERRQKIKKGVKESELDDYNDAVEKAVLRAFAEIENRRLNIEKRDALQRRREAEKEEKDHVKAVNMFKRERSWAETDRREQRVGNWRSFQKGGKRRKEIDAQGWKEESRDEKKFGEADNEAYKRGWK
ncbi:unnamed protein product [Peronospora belbahrii]|uniref:J domain-containing protein n=1 Tax=Peronospora belbahrii TaxID=622444 RepID=A0ABN8CUJ7_9STRA|nr:unnamed protein product [Peronospora belbahrii]